MGGKKQASKGKRKKAKAILITLICVLVAALAVCIVFLVINTQLNDRIMSNTSALKGVTVNGVDISGMDRDAALEATAGIEDELLSKINISFSVEGESFQYTGQELGVDTDYEEVMDEALAYGNTGTLEERKAAIDKAETEGAAFTVSIKPDRQKMADVLLPLKSTLDTQPVDASCVFTPWGHTADGTPFEQDEQAMIEAAADGKQWDRPELARIPDSEMPIQLRYKYWKNDKYIDNYKPADANISRFVYTEGVNGRSVDMEAVVDAAFSQIESGAYSDIPVPVTPVEPAVKVEDLKKSTQLISSWTSSYSNHSSFNRNWNVTKLSGIVNGATIQPGQEWSINTEAGDRTSKGGWKDAAGIVDGGYVDQPGGGVCQISSTTYNAVIRSAMEITDSTHHSIPSDYIPFGLDATISSFGGPDLKFKNPYATPVYMVSYVDPKEKTATVEIYGPLVPDSTYGDVILDFSFEDGGTFGAPVMTYIYNSTKAPDGTALAAGQAYEYAKIRPGRNVETFIHYISLDGNELEMKSFHKYSWNPQNGKTYVNGPDPATVTPTPPPVPTLPPETSPETVWPPEMITLP